MDDTDRLLHEAGDRWRASQPPPPAIHPASLEALRRRWIRLSYVVAGVAALGVIIGVLGWVRQQGSSIGAGGQSTCDITRPGAPFLPPSPYPSSFSTENEWFGSAALWTFLPREGKVVRRLINPPRTFSDKTFWFSVAWSVQDELEPAITVIGTQLDGTGTFSFSPGTNAGAEFGTAMLVGIDIPTAGCWRITGQYRDASLSYVVRAADD